MMVGAMKTIQIAASVILGLLHWANFLFFISRMVNFIGGLLVELLLIL